MTKEYAAVSVAGYLLNELNDFRNHPNPDSCCDIFFCRVTAALGYTLLLAASLIEAVVRIALGALPLVPCAVASVFCCSKAPIYLPMMILGTVAYSYDAALRALIALVQNAYKKNIEFEELAISEFCA